MPLCDKTGCQLTLIGQLKVISDETQEKYILVENTQLSELFFVHIDQNQFSKIHKFGFVGMLLSIQGELREIDQKIKIVARKIDFLYMPTSGKFDYAQSCVDDVVFDEQHIAKLKQSNAYQSRLYYDALRNVH
ncbi:MAG: hypothetical protein ACD_42C00114G0005 [uncultured bacterium]|nr:MAG: hypothetical protein ACD_42C00114G0005 [uncultured bacterium]OGT32518.1 MAG: hypothetical protein A3C44_02085 [Gammaproteobacteria bacterium RIFCSPHIGHO2_02_FULL_39_13]OGT48326.1 MAG: hypothetical protein A3E53_05780 [Gammaproteobacteria bacterium RIFCSPHIGHO2_12_FULL_39_24]